ncbi:cytochrome P450 [Penicillium malachiteum]|nr:cytochrome P450 [Penicillium malachiteum]
MNMTQWFNYYAIDVMGDLSFGRSFDMVADREDKYFYTQLHTDMGMIGLFSHLLWLFPFFKRIPGINADYVKFWGWLAAQVQYRKDTESRSYPQRTCKDKFLEAIINETIRFHHVVPSCLQRMTPPEGLQIGETYIPGDVMVQMPMHAMFRDEHVFVDERVFENPDDFIPERWSTRPELIKEPASYMPFGAGPYACVGKQLALMEIRRVTAEILTRYDVSFAAEVSEEAFWNGKIDAFTLVAAPMELNFTSRK